MTKIYPSLPNLSALDRRMGFISASGVSPECTPSGTSSWMAGEEFNQPTSMGDIGLSPLDRGDV